MCVLYDIYRNVLDFSVELEKAHANRKGRDLQGNHKISSLYQTIGFSALSGNNSNIVRDRGKYRSRLFLPPELYEYGQVSSTICDECRVRMCKNVEMCQAREGVTGETFEDVATLNRGAFW